MRYTRQAVTLEYDDIGNGLPLVLLHAFPLDRTLWRSQIAGLQITSIGLSRPTCAALAIPATLMAKRFSLTSSYTGWQYGWQSHYDAGTERRSSRLALSPSLSLPFSSIPWLTATTTVTANLNFYGQSLDPVSGGIVEDPLFTRNVVAAVEIVGPVFFRLFYGRDGRARLKSIIEPYVSYTYDSPTNDADRVVTSYGFFRYHQLSYGVTGRFLFKARDERAVEVFSLGLGQTYYLSPEDGPLSNFPVDGEAPRFSELTGTIRFYPQTRFSLDASVAYNPYYKNLSSLRIGATAARAEWTLGACVAQATGEDWTSVRLGLSTADLVHSAGRVSTRDRA